MRINPATVRHLRRGGIVAYPTESCYGLGGLPHRADALRKILRLKQRPQHKGLIVIADKLSRLTPYLRPLSPTTQARLQNIWPAPATYLLDAGNVLPALRGRRRKQLAVRIPDHTGARRLCRMLGNALISTSCNRSGRKPCKTAREVRRQFGCRIHIIRGRTGNRKQPSTIIEWQSGQKLR
ncbi:L-threonylcarbamoyladenylate synthase [Conchiformibius kuhniae]|uniref:Threonylcarbamoyl-AMP synthase n=1 Tax=Conchiformibius kuhniae TaxID=211502 RepID=A0ABD8B747_9NEIS|nr:L-threonylcarbamoyladenylate synthase [Conchiformibius kuhniae]